MGVIAIQNNIDGSELTSVSGSGRLCDLLPDFDFTHALILKNGERITPVYELGDDEIIYVRKLPGDAAGVAVVIGLIGIIGKNAADIFNEYLNKKQQEAEEDAQRRAKDLAQKIDTLPFIKGARNKAALGNSIQYIIGDVRNAPYMLTDGFYELGGTDGDKLFYNAILSLGYGRQQVKKVYCGDELLNSNDSGITSGIHTMRTESLFYDSNNLLELRQSGEQFTTNAFKNKVICVSDGAEIKHDFDSDGEPLFRTCPDYTQKVEIVIEFNGLRKYENDAWTSHSVTVTPSWSNDDGATWHTFTFDGGSNTFTRNSKKTLRFKATKTFTAAECYGKKIKIKLERSVKLESNSNEDCYLLFMQSYCYDNKLSTSSSLVSCAAVNSDMVAKTTRLGVRLIANDNTNGELDEFACDVSGLARTWNGTAWSTQKAASRNPAAWALEILTSDKHLHSQYADSELDLESFGEWYEYCESEHFYADTIIAEGKTKKEIIDALCAISGGAIYTSPLTGKKTAAVDKKELYPIALFNSQDIISMSYEKSLERRYDGLKVTFTNRDNWSVDTRDVMLDGGERTEDDKLSELAPEFVTDADHAYKLAQRTMRMKELEPRTLTVKCGADGEFYPLFSRVKVQFNELKIGIRSSVIKGVGYVGSEIAQLQIADYVDFVPGVRYGVIIQAVTSEGRSLYSAEVTGAGRTRTLSLVEYITPGEVVPCSGCVLTFGELDDNGEFTKVTSDFKIYGIAPDGSDAYTLTLKDYNEAVYEYGDIPAFKSNITHARRLTQRQISDINKAALDAGINALEQAKAEIKTITTLDSLEQPGTAGEWGSYRSRLYQYINGAWTPAAAPGYLGAYSSGTPELTEGNYFLAVADFIAGEVMLADDINIFAIGEDALGSHDIYHAGSVYIALSDSWAELTDKTDWRYLIAAPDMEYYGFATPEAAALAVSGAESRYVATVQTLAGLEARSGSLVVYDGYEAGFVRGDVYKKTPTGWEHLDPTSAAAEQDYQKCFSAIRAVAADNSGSFVNLYAQKIVSLEAAIRELSSKVITLQDGGLIKSGNFDGTIDENGNITDVGIKGFAVTYTGESVFNSGRFRGDIETDVLKVTKEKTVSQVANYAHTTDYTANAFYGYIKQKLAPFTPSAPGTTTTSVKDVFGENHYLMLDGVKYTSQLTVQWARIGVGVAPPIGVEEVWYLHKSWQVSRLMPLLSTIATRVGADAMLHVDFKEYMEQDGATVVKFDNILQGDPHISGQAFLDGMTLKVSQG